MPNLPTQKWLFQNFFPSKNSKSGLHSKSPKYNIVKYFFIITKTQIKLSTVDFYVTYTKHPVCQSSPLEFTIFSFGSNPSPQRVQNMLSKDIVAILEYQSIFTNNDTQNFILQ